MKLLKQVLIGLLAIFFVFVGCDGDNGNGKPECTCPPAPTHFLECDDYGCEVGGHQQTAHEYVTDNAGNQVPIYQKSNVDTEHAAEAANRITTVYNSASLDLHRDTISGKINKIWVLTGNAYSFDKATGILELGINWDASELEAIFVYEVVPTLSNI